MALNFPDAPVANQVFTVGNASWIWDTVKWVASSTAQVIPYTSLPAEVQQIPIAFPIAGKPAANGTVNVPTVMALTIATSLAGTIGGAITAATAAAAFTLNKITVAGVTTALGTITAPAGAKSGFTLSGAGGSLAIGDLLQLVAPGTQDSTLADLGITVMALRV